MGGWRKKGTEVHQGRKRILRRRFTMKSMFLRMLLGMIVLVGLSTGVCEANGVDFSIWNGSLWKIKLTAKGVLFSNPSIPGPPDQKARGTEQSWGVMSSNADGSTMNIQVYEKNDAGDCVEGDLIPLTKWWGGPEGFIATIELSTGDPKFFMIRGLLNFIGKLKNNILNTGKIITLGGYVLQEDWDTDTDIAAYGFTLSGTLLKEPQGCLPSP